MKTTTLEWVTKLFRYSLLSGAILYIVFYLILAFLRIQYPFELEWSEGASVDQVRRIISGQKLYVRPSLEFIPSMYTPLYFYISAAVSSILGIGFVPLRLLSFLSSLGCFFIIFLIVKRETGSKFSGILSSCLFAATFQITGAWFDIARPDSLFLFFLLTAVYLVKFKTSVKSYVLAGAFISFSFLTKQTALIIFLPIMLYCFLSDRRCSIFFIGTTVMVIGLSTLFLNHVYDGWYNYYTFYLPSQDPIAKSMFINFWTKDLISPLSIACIMSTFYLLAQFLDSNKKNYLFYLLLAIGMLGGSWSSRLCIGGVLNCLFPAYAVISIMFGLGIHSVFKFIQVSSVDKRRLRLFEIFIYLICVIQFAGLIYNPLDHIPTQKDLEAGRKFINTMAQMEGDIYVPFYGYLPTLAGKNSYATNQAMNEILWSNDEVKTELINGIKKVIREKRFTTIIVLDNSAWFKEFQEDIDKYYIRKGQLFDSKTLFWPLKGTRGNPEFIYVPESNDTL